MAQVRRAAGRSGGQEQRSYSSHRTRRAPRKKTGRNPNGWQMKLGAWAHARLREAQYDSVSRKVLQGTILGFCGLIIIGMCAAFGVFDKAQKFISATTITAVRSVGLSVHNIDIATTDGSKLSDSQKAEVTAIAGIPSDSIMFSVSPQLIHDRVNVLSWVENVTVRRLWPDTIQIIVKPRSASAVWQENGTLQYMDLKGNKLGPADPQKVKGLPLVIGSNAGANAEELFAALETRTEIASRVYAMVRVGDRRWNLKLKSGGDVLLPEDNMVPALDELARLQQQYRILDREFASLDVRKTGAIVILPKEPEAEPVETKTKDEDKMVSGNISAQANNTVKTNTSQTSKVSNT